MVTEKQLQARRNTGKLAVLNHTGFHGFGFAERSAIGQKGGRARAASGAWRQDNLTPANALRGSYRGAHIRWHVKRGVTSPRCGHCIAEKSSKQ